MDMLVSMVPSIIGAVIGGLFVLVAVKWQFRQQSKAAFRALRVEVSSNKEAAVDMTRQLGTAFELGRPDPGWLKHSLWDSQLPYVVQLFDEGTLIIARYAYSLLDAVPRNDNSRAYARRAVPGSSLYARGGWIDEHLNKVRIAFQDADQALENLRKPTLWQSVKNALVEGWKKIIPRGSGMP